MVDLAGEGGGGKTWAEFSLASCGIWDVFACSSTATRAIDKRRPQQDSAHQVGPEITLHRILMVVVSCCTWGEDVWGGIFCPQTLEMFWPTLQQPAELWTNGCETHSSNSPCCNYTHSSLQLTVLYSYTVLSLHGHAS